MSEHFRAVSDILITRDTVVASDGQDAMKVVVTRTNGKFIHEFTVNTTSEIPDYSDAKVLTITWLALGLFTPLSARTEVLAEHGLSRASFSVTEDGIEIARAYRELTGADITEAI